LTKKYFILNEQGIKEISFGEFLESNKKPESLFLMDLQTDAREFVADELSSLDIPQRILDKLTKPGENIRFSYSENFLYGEIASFSEFTRKSDYTGLIIHNNVLIGIHHDAIDVLNYLKQFMENLTVAGKKKINAQGFLFSMMFEILSDYGKLILKFRENIEVVANRLEEKNKALNLKKLLLAKSQLSDFSRVLEKLFYTLSFPPSKDVLDLKSSYLESFDYLLRITTLLTTSIQQTEDRLESLNDHYQLLLQNKANKRLNLLTIVQAIFVPLTLVVGVYGMNFTYMPELNYHFGYFVSLGAMFLFVLISLFYFYKKGWFKD